MMSIKKILALFVAVLVFVNGVNAQSGFDMSKLPLVLAACPGISTALLPTAQSCLAKIKVAKRACPTSCASLIKQLPNQTCRKVIQGAITDPVAKSKITKLCKKQLAALPA